MQRHLITLDLDGTTLANDSTVSQLTINVLRYLDQLGHIIVIVTGRPYRSAKHIYETIAIDQPLVNFNGALCHYPNHPNWKGSYHIGLDRFIALDTSRRRKELKSSLIIVEEKDHIFSTSLDLPQNEYFPNMEKHPPIILTDKALKANPTAVTIFTKDEDQATTRDKLLSLYGRDVDVRTWGGVMPCLEMVSKGVTKGLALKHLTEYYDIDPCYSLAFGDEDNDREMLQLAGRGVAMANAIDSLKELADDVTLYSNDEDGLALYLIDYFKLNDLDFCLN
ncbi:HAD family phosphatase [Atopobacter sp. AH10]|uniref:Cof-type HAD-IIB family hydrolase n=1 Tax=Atopobacter sp. AH10 TaxID=2315861 RepID=UPI000EF20A2B|nr:Cof-type HAD-IIB family hydrolase [Atopobacter sp. AH10]RLK63272.1 HAD family phosphatase [Atopobacter sp. AH10]